MRSALLLSLVTAALVGFIGLTRNASKQQPSRPDLATGDDESYLFVG